MGAVSWPTSTPRRNSHRATWWREPTSVPCRRKAASRSCSTFRPWAQRTLIWRNSYATGSQPSTPTRVRSASIGARNPFPWLPRPTTGWAASAPTCSDEPAFPVSMRPANAPELVCRVLIVSHRTRCLKAWFTDIAPALPLQMTLTVPFGNRRTSTTARSKTCRSASSRCCCVCRMP